MIERQSPKSNARTWLASVAAAAAFMLLAATVPASAQLVGGPKEPFLEEGPIPRITPLGHSRIDYFNGNLGGHPSCSATYQKVPEGGAAGASQAEIEREGTRPAPSIDLVCIPCIGLAVGVISLLIGLYGFYRDLSADPDWTYKQSVTCSVTGYEVWAGGSGALLRRVSIEGDGEDPAKCEYEGVVDNHCQATFSAPSTTLTYTKTFTSDIVASQAQPCFQPDARARNDPMVAAMEVVHEEWKPVVKTFQDFHPEGICTPPVDLEPREVPSPSDGTLADPGSWLGGQNHQP